ncbi:alpha/beta fold hydrolase [Lentzea sp. NPDC042327]|uniref:thioesterase II family protein n=1 Tax=Lentzea sp. NPDC042327 TaxID=3154801 RepID=UPI0033C61D6B
MSSGCGSEVFVFPGAGSYGSDCRALLRSGTLVKYPGRFGRSAPAASFGALVEACAEQVTGERPVLVGHSFGAYVAYAVAGVLETSGVAVERLVVLGAVAPSRHSVAPESISDTEAYLERVAPGLVAGEWRDVVVETAARDMTLLGEFRPSDHPVLRCPVFAAHGEEDPLTSPAGVAAWAEVTTGVFTRTEFPGGHSALLEAPDLL